MILLAYERIHVDIFLIDMRCLLCKSPRSIVTKPCKFCSKDRVKKKKKKKMIVRRKKTDSIRVMKPAISTGRCLD